jgi:hypothetical protein
MNIITEAEQFYGYLTGLHVEQRAKPDMKGNVSPKLYATFEYGPKVSVWEVPDLQLFKILAEHLCQMAWARRENAEYGYEKLYIKRANGRWHVDLP